MERPEEGSLIVATVENNIDAEWRLWPGRILRVIEVVDWEEDYKSLYCDDFLNTVDGGRWYYDAYDFKPYKGELKKKKKNGDVVYE